MKSCGGIEPKDRSFDNEGKPKEPTRRCCRCGKLMGLYSLAGWDKWSVGERLEEPDCKCVCNKCAQKLPPDMPNTWM